MKKLVCCMLASFIGSALGGPDDENDPQRLAEMLGDPRYEIRETAHRRLAGLGSAARLALEAAAKGLDAERKLRAETLLAELDRATLWEPSMVSIGPGTMTSTEAFKSLEKQSGNPIKWSASAKTERPALAFDGRRKKYWEALDEISRAADLTINFYDDAAQGGGVVSLVAPYRFPVAYVGPFRMRVKSIRRNLNSEIRFDDAEPESHDSWNLSVQLHWEQRLLLARYRGRPFLLEARTDAGEDLAPKRPPGSREVWSPITGRNREINYSMTLNPPTKPAAKLATLRIASEFVAIGDRRVMKLPLTRVGAETQSSGYRLQLDGLERTDSEVTIVVHLYRSEPLDIAGNQPELVDELLTVRSGNQSIPFNVSRTVGGRKSVQYTLKSRVALQSDAELNFQVGGLSSQKVIEFRFENISMP